MSKDRLLDEQEEIQVKELAFELCRSDGLDPYLIERGQCRRRNYEYYLSEAKSQLDLK